MVGREPGRHGHQVFIPERQTPADRDLPDGCVLLADTRRVRFPGTGRFLRRYIPGVRRQPQADTVTPSWSLDYLIHFIRYSLPILPTFLAGVFGYRYASGVDWYGYAPPEGEALRALNTTDYAAEATAGLIEGTKLPADARLIAIKAEQHYIQIYSDRGNDLVRYRFRDLAKTLTGSSGLQTHRSWWVNLNRVESCETDGRKLKLQLDNELTVPVSISYRNSVLAALDSQTSNADQA